MGIDAQAQPGTSITGRVTDETGQYLPGITVLIRDSTNGTTTDAECRHRLLVPAGIAVLVASYVGYGTQEIPVNAKSVIDFKLAPDNKTLSELVVVRSV